MDKGNYDAVAVGLIHEEFREAKQLINLIESFEKISGSLIKTEQAVQTFTRIFDEYQEQPHLLDPHLEQLINLIIEKVRKHEKNPKCLHLLFKCLYMITKTRGSKVITRHLPHEVADVEPVLRLIANHPPSTQMLWENRYCLLLWLSMVCMIPFDLSRLDNAESGDGRAPVMTRIIQATQDHLAVTDKASDAAAFTLAKFLTRPDVRAAKASEVIQWATEQLNKFDGSRGSAAMTTGVMKMLAQLYKLGKREDLLPFASSILMDVNSNKRLTECENTIIRKLATKLIQRIGLVFLKAKVAGWRYMRGSRSLAANLPSSASSAPSISSASSGPSASSAPLAPSVSSAPSASFQSTTLEGEEEDEYDMPDEMEDVIDFLLTRLKDKDTIVRWSAAKGVGRVCGRLPRELADDIIESLLELFTIHETDAAWHGGCLALAELGRRGLLLPGRLPQVVPVVLKSLLYDEKHGVCSIGVHVRDAACYVCWSFARAYEPSDLKPYVNQIANALVVVSVFDREVNVRRAAAAAFQENVGRQGTFPHGIDILTMCDYHAVGVRNHSYIELSKYVAQFAEYRRSLMEHLVEYKLSHWDIEIRQLASVALFNLVLPDKSSNNHLLSRLAGLAVGSDLNSRHGSILAIGQICRSLANQINGPVSSHVDPSVLDEIFDIDSKLRGRKMLLGLGGELMRKAICPMISDLAKAGIGIDRHSEILARWHMLFIETIQFVEPEVQAAAVESFSSYLALYEDGEGNIAEDTSVRIIEELITTARVASDEQIRIGVLRSLGALAPSTLSANVDLVISSLITLAHVVSNSDTNWAESRSQAFTSLDRVREIVGISDKGLIADHVNRLFSEYQLGLEDYTIDGRGDVGACVREACMSGLLHLMKELAEKNPSLFQPDVVKNVFCLIAQQACEKIDRTRGQAGSVFSALLHNTPEIPHVPRRDILQNILKRMEVDRINFAAPSMTFSRFGRLLALSEYRYHVLLGFTVSVGGLTESLVKHSHTALMEYIQQCSSEEIREFCTTVISLYQDFKKVDRVMIPLLKMTEQLLAGRILDDLEGDDGETFASNLFDCVKLEIKVCGNPQKLMSSINVICSLLSECLTIRDKALFQIAVFLCHRFPKVRKTAASQLFEALITAAEVVDDENYDRVLSIVSDTQWDEPVEQIKPLRNELCDLLNINQPKPLKKV